MTAVAIAPGRPESSAPAAMRHGGDSRMDLFALDDDIALWEAQLPALHDGARLSVLVPLCWHLRQRNPLRALQMAEEADAWLDQPMLFSAEQQAAKARIMLVRAEAAWLTADLMNASALAEAALASFTELNDPLGMADAHWNRALI